MTAPRRLLSSAVFLLFSLSVFSFCSLPYPVSCQIAEISQLISSALNPLSRLPIDFLGGGSSTLSSVRNEESASVSSQIADNALLSSTLQNGQKVLRTVAQTASGLIPSVIQEGILQPTDDGRRRAISLTAFNMSPLDQAIISAVGEVGSFHWTAKQPSSVTVDATPTLDSRNLRKLNLALGLHGLPPLPFAPRKINESSEEEELAVDVLIDQVIQGRPLSKDILKQYRDTVDASLYRTMQLPPVAMPGVCEGLAASPWPAPHRTGFAQASSPYRGPDGSKRLSHNFLNRAVIANNPITLFYSEDQKYLWGSSWTTIFKVARGKSSLRLVDYVAKPVEKVFADKFHGAYALLTKEEVFVVSSGDHLEAYYDKPGSNSQQIMMHPEKFDITNELANEVRFPQRPEEVIRALCMSSDGHIVWATSHGRVGVLNRNIKGGSFRKAADWLMLGTSVGYDKDLEVSNNMACDDEGGIYVVSDKFMHRVDWNGRKLKIRWEKPYATSTAGGTQAVRLGAGSGSTPSIMGEKGKKYVVITDDADIMNVLIMDAQTGEIKAAHPINFRNSSAKHTSSEQSVLVHGWRLAVVNNTPTEELKQTPNFLKMFGSPAALLLGGGEVPTRISETLTNAWPVIVGDAPKGVEQLEFNPDDNTLRVTWVNTEVSIPNGIPTMSATSGLMYGIGKRGHFGSEAAPMRGMWTLEALDWWTGESKFYYNIGMGPMVNSIYAATQVGPGEIITGTATGIVRIMEV
ncbi:putative transmembrane protein [Toxoplasma gondii TgCatPRC2]|uniref:Putative transmembrane protein n=1 Tax=Toxoplasma gondii TgCatPRC2 TaxID=1130821 RepID=A0A151H308_TOXGO|nr:putative transmembrane protein [Toxoplasma gondii TgCatPRC2]